MSIHMNLHPNEKWETVSIEYLPPGSGSCIQIMLDDATGERYNLAIHHCLDAPGLIAMLKKGFAALPDLQTDEVKGDENDR